MKIVPEYASLGSALCFEQRMLEEIRARSRATRTLGFPHEREFGGREIL